MNVLWLHLRIFGALTVSLLVLIGIIQFVAWSAREIRRKQTPLRNVVSQNGRHRNRCTPTSQTPLVVHLGAYLSSD